MGKKAYTSKYSDDVVLAEWQNVYSVIINKPHLCISRKVNLSEKRLTFIQWNIWYVAYTLTYVYETDTTQNKCIAIQFKKWVFTYESPVLKTMTMSDERMNYGTDTFY